MGIMRIHPTGGPGRGVPAALALTLTTAGILVGSGTVAAAQRGAVAGQAAGREAAAGTISTVAGGLGGPAKGTKVALGYPCGVGYGAGSVYVGSATVVRKLNPVGGQVATEAGTGLGTGSGN